MTERGATIGKRAVCTHSESVLRHHALSVRRTDRPPPAVEEPDDEHVVCVDVVATCLPGAYLAEDSDNGLGKKNRYGILKNTFPMWV